VHLRERRDIVDGQNDLENVITLLSSIILLGGISKYLHIVKIYNDYGLQTELITKVVIKLMPFMAIFLLWNAFFAM